MSRFVRSSKYRHVFGQSARKECSIENVKVSSSAWDTNLISASGLYVSINWQASGGGAFAILPAPSPFSAYTLPYKLPDIIPLARGHSATVLDTAWSPFNDSICVSAGEDGKALVWKVESSDFQDWGAEKWVPRDFDPVSRIAVSPRKIGQVRFNPIASHVLATASGDYAVKLWDLESSDEAMITLKGHGDSVQDLTFNYTGTVIATTCRDRKLRLFDARAGADPIRVTDGHGGVKGSRLAWMGDKDRIATTGFSKMSDRQLAVWETGSLKNVVTTNIDQSAGVVMPFWSDNGVLFLAGKGDGNIRYYEYDADNVHPLSEYKSSDPQRGMTFLPRRSLNVAECEIGRAFKVSGSLIEPIAFIVPRKADSFQSDIFPPAPSLEPALSATEYFAGKTAQPNLVDLDSGVITAAAPTRPATVVPSEMPPPPTREASVSLQPTQPEAISMPPSRKPTEPVSPVVISEPEPTQVIRSEVPASSRDDVDELKQENQRLRDELRESKAKIRNLEVQVETMRANAQRAAKALQLE
ncbi:DUF1900-domain-containing protein [Clavulina sp. PMI_390]|nr:DUF1900-domain-containing protein [Clavulina sp. PMI_390]